MTPDRSLPGAAARRLPRRLVSPLEERFLVESFRQLLPVDSRVETHLRGVLEAVLSHPGSLVRAKLAYGFLRRHAVDADQARAVAVAIEYFHTASLIFDDLPSMDDATERRGHPCPHLVYGEAAATLGALALINQAYALLWEVLGTLPPERRRAAAELVASCLGVGGILNGQSHDLHFDGSGRGPTGGGEDDVLRVAEGKTASLIRLTLLLPAIVAGVEDETRQRLDRLATVWGLSYQILDDFKDCLMSHLETGKSTDRDSALGRPNLARQLGWDRAMERLDAFLGEGRELLGHFTSRRWLLLREIQAILDHEQETVFERLMLAKCA